jgi:hypothetical protein
MRYAILARSCHLQNFFFAFLLLKVLLFCMFFAML